MSERCVRTSEQTSERPITVAWHLLNTLPVNRCVRKSVVGCVLYLVTSETNFEETFQVIDSFRFTATKKGVGTVMLLIELYLCQSVCLSVCLSVCPSDCIRTSMTACPCISDFDIAGRLL